MNNEINTERVLFIVRGIPGSGKSTLVELIADKVCVADDYHIIGGEYKFDFRNISDSHAWCQKKCRHYMQIGVPKLAVANTSVKERDLKPYYEMARKYNYTVFSIIVENRHEGKSIHGVAEKTIEKMKNKFSIKL